ncbi:MAG: response regulator, partial [Rhodospirillales bacterium]|nr:response regulator [Rhodospirillales bacterium]
LALQDPFLIDVLPKYISHWGGKVTTQSSFELLETQIAGAAKSSTPFDVLYVENVGLQAGTDIIRTIQNRSPAEAPNFVFHVDKRPPEEEALEDTVYATFNPIKRGTFLRAIAAGLGIASPDFEFDEDDESHNTAINAPTIEEAEAAGQLILMAEDNMVNQKVIQRQLNNLGYAVVMADDGEKALKALGEKDYVMLLTDCHMPNMDGFSLTKEIRRREKQSKDVHLPIIAITASALTEEVGLCYDAGMDDFLSKPVELPKLNATIKKWMPAAKHTIVSASPEKVKADSASPVDLTFLETNFGSETDLIHEILKDFVQPSQECHDEVGQAIMEKSLQGVADGVHKLKSAARTIGANDVADTCEKMELASKGGDWAPVKNLAPDLSRQLNDVFDYIEHL